MPPPLGELFGEVARLPEVDFVRGPAVERAMRHHGVVLLDVERDETLDGGRGVERVQEEPGMLQVAPEALNTIPMLVTREIASTSLLRERAIRLKEKS